MPDFKPPATSPDKQAKVDRGLAIQLNARIATRLKRNYAFSGINVGGIPNDPTYLDEKTRVANVAIQKEIDAIAAKKLKQKLPLVEQVQKPKSKVS